MREGLLAEKVGMSRFYDKDKINLVFEYGGKTKLHLEKWEY